MASYERRTLADGSFSYRLRAFLCKDSYGKQLTKSTTWRAPKGLSEKEADELAQAEADTFETTLLEAETEADINISFIDYCHYVNKEKGYKKKTYVDKEGIANYLAKHMPKVKLVDLKSSHIKKLYDDLRKTKKENGGVAVPSGFPNYFKMTNLSMKEFSRRAGIAFETLQKAVKGQSVTEKVARKMCQAADVRFERAFEMDEASRFVSEEAIYIYHRYIVTVLNQAIKEGLIEKNVASNLTNPPKPPKKKVKHLDLVQAFGYFIFGLVEEDIRYRTMVMILLFTGIRRGELCAMKFPKIMTLSQKIIIDMSTSYTKEDGIYDTETKTEDSDRIINIEWILVDFLKQYALWYAMRKIRLGNKWRGTEDHIFIQKDGRQLFPSTINKWLDLFTEKHTLDKSNPHHIRHDFASMAILSTSDLQNIADAMGHKDIGILISVYLHGMGNENRHASEGVSNLLIDFHEQYTADE